MLQTYDPMELSQNPYWMELLQLYNSLKKMLPEKYIQGSQKEISDQKEISQAILPLMYEEAEKAVVWNRKNLEEESKAIETGTIFLIDQVTAIIFVK